MTSAPTIHGKRAVFSASAVLEAVGRELGAIKQADGLTWADMGRVLGKSEDQAAKYADGTAEMGIVAFAAAKREWNGRFTRSLDRLCLETRRSDDSDQSRQTKVLRAALAIAEGLEDDEEFCQRDVATHRAKLEAARDAIDELLRKAVGA